MSASPLTAGRYQRCIPRNSLLRYNLRPTLPHRVRIGRQCSLHPHFNSFKGTKGQVCQELCTSGCTQVYEVLVDVREHLLSIEIFEYLVETIFTSTLKRVAHEGRSPSEKYAADALCPIDRSPGAKVSSVYLWVDLTPGFHLANTLVRIYCIKVSTKRTRSSGVIAVWVGPMFVSIRKQWLLQLSIPQAAIGC